MLYGVSTSLHLRIITGVMAKCPTVQWWNHPVVPGSPTAGRARECGTKLIHLRTTALKKEKYKTKNLASAGCWSQEQIGTAKFALLNSCSGEIFTPSGGPFGGLKSPRKCQTPSWSSWPHQLGPGIQWISGKANTRSQSLTPAGWHGMPVPVGG